MTITCPSSPAVPTPLIHRILAAHRLTVSARGPVALLLLAELVQLGAPTTSTLRCWSSIGWLLTSCAVGDDGFARFGRQAMEIWDTSREDLCAAEASCGRRRVPRVIEATCREVA